MTDLNLGLPRVEDQNLMALTADGQVKRVLYGSATLDFPSVASVTDSDLTIAVAGAKVGDPVFLATPAAPTGNMAFTAFVSAADVVTVRAHNYTAGALDPTSAAYAVLVFGVS